MWHGELCSGKGEGEEGQRSDFVGIEWKPIGEMGQRKGEGRGQT